MITSTISVAILIGICEAIKRATELKTKYIPTVAIILGIIYSLSLNGVDAINIWEGVVTGLVSVGLFSGVRSTIFS